MELNAPAARKLRQLRRRVQIDALARRAVQASAAAVPPRLPCNRRAAVRGFACEKFHKGVRDDRRPAPARAAARSTKRSLAGERISDADALTLYASHDLNALGAMANLVRERKNGNVATYLLNRYINYSNVCLLSCQFCAFAARKRDAHAFEQAIPEIVATVRGALGAGDHGSPHGRRAAPVAAGRSGISICCAACARSTRSCT